MMMILLSSSIRISPPPVVFSCTSQRRRRQAFCWYPQSQSQSLVVVGRRKRKKKKHKDLCCSCSCSCSGDDDDYQVLSAINTSYNDIIILDTCQSRMLLLDSTHNIHSIIMKDQHQPWTGSYWDEFASLPPIVPDGPIAIFGLGGGTAAHLMLTLWPSLHLHGWEIDPIVINEMNPPKQNDICIYYCLSVCLSVNQIVIVDYSFALQLIDKAREHLGLSDLEKHTQGGGVLNVHVGDALSTSASVSGGYAGIVIDLFSGGEVLPQLQEVQTWLELNDKLMPNGRLMVNCGGSTSVAGSMDSCVWDWEKNSTLKSLCEAFPGQVNWKKMPKSEGENYLALTGPLPDLTLWTAALPDRLGSSVVQWASCFP